MLLNILQNSQENICAGVSFYLYELWEDFKNIFFTENLRTLNTNTLPTYLTLPCCDGQNNSLEVCNIFRVMKKKA